MRTSSRSKPFLLAAALLVIVCIAVLQLPDIGLVQFERRRELSSAQAGWAYRLLVLAALLQIFFGGWRVLRVERVAEELEDGRSVDRLDDERVVGRLARTSAVMVILTVAYGVAALVLTAERGGFWLFALLAVAQGAWYYREVGVIARWVQGRGETGRPRAPTWTGAPQDYVPPIARALIPDSSAKTGARSKTE